MTIEMNGVKGNVSITMDAIASIAGNAATECYGIVGMVPKTGFRLFRKNSFTIIFNS